MRSDRLGETLLPKRVALPVFASDALSSVAYAPDEIFLMLGVAGFAAYSFSWKIGLCVAFVMLVVVASYRQNVHAYPSGGGDYEVATVNLGPTPGLTVASALLVDYVLTVAVSISSAAQYAASTVEPLAGHEVTVAVAAVVLLMAANLRGVRESGTAFAVPTYAFMVAILGMAAWGFGRYFFGELPPVESAKFELVPEPGYEQGIAGIAGAFLLLRAFSSGCAALTGVEAISNGVPAFRTPKSKNAATTLLLLGTIAVTMMLSIIVLAKISGLRFAENVSEQLLLNGEHGEATKAGVQFPNGETYVQDPVIGQLAKSIFDNLPLMAAVVTTVTGLILVLAANTAFNGFPVLGLDPRPGPLPAPPDAHPGRPARLQQRHRDPGRLRDRAHRRLRRRGDAADPALHRRCLRLVHVEPDRHGPALDPAARDRAGPGRPAPGWSAAASSTRSASP